jgi:hypothetical protein
MRENQTSEAIKALYDGAGRQVRPAVGGVSPTSSSLDPVHPGKAFLRCNALRLTLQKL